MLHYKKNDNTSLFSSFNDENLTHITKIQNYIPIYNKFFQLTNKTFNSINLNNNTILKLNKKETYQTFNCNVKTNENKELFFKFSPLLDPVKYLTGKYTDINTKELPKFKGSTCHEKLLDTNNTAYIDGFFYYLSSLLLNKFDFINGADFFGSFLGIKAEFKYNIYDDLDYLYDSTFFNKNRDTLFNASCLDDDFFEDASLKNKKKLVVGSENIELQVSTFDNKIFDSLFEEEGVSNLTVGNLKKQNLIHNLTNKTSSSCSSRSSNTSKENDDDEEEEDDEDEDEEDEDEEEDESEYSEDSGSTTSSAIENLESIIFDFPVQIICLEKMKNTLDSLMNDEFDITDAEWRAILMQIIMILITYQKCFNFTHNDLHTNNVMYNKTDKKFIYYRYEGKIYKVPTFGKIFKLIDFGRSIYKFKGVQLCSDSFHPKGDAATQYNFGPYYNDKKPKIEPNYSFDLCRLACSFYDFFIEDENKLEGPIAKLIYSWIIDDNGKNILYKKNGDERYPDFKLYKMITRLVHNHTPQKQLENPLFKKFLTSRKKK